MGLSRRLSGRQRRRTRDVRAGDVLVDVPHVGRCVVLEVVREDEHGAIPHHRIGLRVRTGDGGERVVLGGADGYAYVDLNGGG